MIISSFVGAPLVSTFFSDSSCFLHVLVQPPPVSSIFMEPEFVCVRICMTATNCTLDCGFDFSQYASNPVETSVVPGWIYSFQCSSALLSNYIPVMVLSFLISGVVTPFVQLLFLHLPLSWAERVTPRYMRRRFLDDSLFLLDFNSGETLTSTKTRRRLFNSNSRTCKLLLDITVVLTFGLASPLLAVTVAVDSISAYVMWRVLLRRYLFLCGAENRDEGLQRVEEAAWHSSDGVHDGLQVLVLFAGLFWSLFVLDMLGDVYGFGVGVGMMVVPAVGMPLFYWSVTGRRCGRGNKERTRETGDSVDMELTDNVVGNNANSHF